MASYHRAPLSVSKIRSNLRRSKLLGEIERRRRRRKKTNVAKKRESLPDIDAAVSGVI